MLIADLSGLPYVWVMKDALQHKYIRLWLCTCAALVFLMIVIGAITRLTESGLSIVEWKPVTGALPPLSQDAWQAEFDLYRQSPEFQKKNFWMELGDFKKIYFWEWLHRLLGRVIGLVYALPFFWFLYRRKIPSGARTKLFGLLLLGGAQGAMGWYMVKSGLIDIPAVSHYRLAAHLSLAFLILGALIWMALSFRPQTAQPRSRGLYAHNIAVIALFVLTLLWGAFTAGLDAGMIYNESFPKMGGQWLPPDLWHLQPAWLNFFDHPSGVQFTHRWLAMLTTFTTLSLWGHGYLRRNTPRSLHVLAAAIMIQVALGISTLLSGVALPLAVLHQAGAAIVFILMIMCLHHYRGTHHPLSSV